MASDAIIDEKFKIALPIMAADRQVSKVPYRFRLVANGSEWMRKIRKSTTNEEQLPPIWPLKLLFRSDRRSVDQKLMIVALHFTF